MSGQCVGVVMDYSGDSTTHGSCIYFSRIDRIVHARSGVAAVSTQDFFQSMPAPTQGQTTPPATPVPTSSATPHPAPVQMPASSSTPTSSPTPHPAPGQMPTTLCADTCACWGQLAGAHTCGGRIEWVQANVPGKETWGAAAKLVYDDFPNICKCGTQASTMDGP